MVKKITLFTYLMKQVLRDVRLFLLGAAADVTRLGWLITSHSRRRALTTRFCCLEQSAVSKHADYAFIDNIFNQQQRAQTDRSIPQLRTWPAPHPVKLILCVLLLMGVFFPAMIQAQDTKTYSEFDFIYVDNKIPVNTDGLTDSLLSAFYQKAKAIKNNNETGFLVYLSNVEGEAVVTNREDLTVASLAAMTGSPESGALYDVLQEKKNITEALFAQKYNINTKVRFHFFTSYWFCKRIESSADYSALVSILPYEFLAVNNLSEKLPIEVHLYAPDIKSGIDEDQIEEKLTFRQKSLGRNFTTFLHLF